MNNINLITIAEFAEYAPEVDTSMYTDATISGMISMASQKISDYLNYSPIAEDLVDELRDGKVTVDGDLLITPVKVPVISVSSISVTKGINTLTVNLSSTINGQPVPTYNIDYTKTKIRVAGSNIILTGNPVLFNFYQLRQTQFFTKISYRAGYEVSELPMVFKEACILWLRDIIARRFNTTGASRIRQGGLEIEYYDSRQDDPRGEAADSDMVRDAKRMLKPYRRII